MNNCRGSATLVVLVFITLLAALGIGSAMALHHLHAELQRLDQRQQHRLQLQNHEQSPRH